MISIGSSKNSKTVEGAKSKKEEVDGENCGG
jgi:hypothetical protein